MGLDKGLSPGEIEAGLSERETTAITGHKTAHVFRRYYIVSEKRLAEKAHKFSAYPEQKAGKR